MDLSAAGLNATESKVYLALLTKKEWVPSDLAKNVGETRTNIYKILDKLVSMSLANRYDKNKKLHYSAKNPTQLIALASKNRQELEQKNAALQNNIDDLSSQYFQTRGQPGVRFFQGKAGIQEIYMEQIHQKETIYFLKTRADIEFFGFDFMYTIRNLAPKAGIQRKAFTPDTPETPINTEESDKAMLLDRTWYQPHDYTAPVEWSVYGNKVSIISFGQEAIGMVIDSPQIAESLRQIFSLLDEGLKKRPNYDTLPKNAEFIDSQSFIEKYNNTTPKLPN